MANHLVKIQNPADHLLSGVVRMIRRHLVAFEERYQRHVVLSSLRMR
jgi:hypothetical protein